MEGKGNINRVYTDFCLMDWWPDKDVMRQHYGDEAADNYIVWNFKQRLGEYVNILSISVAQIVSYMVDEEAGRLTNVPKKVMYMCTYEEIPMNGEEDDE